ncbi:MAG: glycerol-3-phosphate dehydrogenase/oxidase [Candidatus Pseudobacter hemicellulosilyticus]|uniref:Glycerol-3-phosphate dehydrogenase/oxidase n=1 Tax=Candidatus Pseudobacter hemicellulosilyticus TaxID=3121375 RepID=A0AAJ6BF87_9BACT|nr:MAG: glycerol-3-phosphate dehydrogenase/oxidase [Pseudobacter sp.]
METIPVYREMQLQQLSSTPLWDLIVIGGGASGLGIALEAQTRGYRTLVLEQHDFAKGTSSRSTKLVHGGVRYLAQGNIGLVREASIERGLLVRNAPHLVKDQRFLIPLYSVWDRVKYMIGLKLYDWIAGGLSLGPSVFISRNETLGWLPTIKPQGLIGGVQYHDGQFDDARLALNLAQTIIDKGGQALNYMTVTGLEKDRQQQVCGVMAEDAETGRRYALRAKVVVNATGVFVDSILRMDQPAAARSIRVSQGVHLVLDRKFHPGNHALMIPKTSDGRVLFAVPWQDKLVVGTTDTPVGSACLEPVALEKEIRFILDTAALYLTQPPTRADVLSVFAGLRPLAAPQGESRQTREISRSHKINVSASRLFTILGGKWTTYRRMGEDMINRIEQELGWPVTRSVTRQLPVHGAGIQWQGAVPESQEPFAFYGTDAAAVRQLQETAGGEWLSEKLAIHTAQVIWAVQREMARTVEDVLARRTRALLLDAAESIRLAPLVAAIMAPLLEKDEAWQAAQVAAYNSIAEKYLLSN